MADISHALAQVANDNATLKSPTQQNNDNTQNLALQLQPLIALAQQRAAGSPGLAAPPLPLSEDSGGDARGAPSPPPFHNYSI